MIRALWAAVIVAFVVGVIYRLLPVILGPTALAQFFLTEDGYLMLTVARNMAIGLGMSVSDGTIPTNGVQPLATFLFAVPYLATGGDKTASLIGVHLISLAAVIGAAFALRALAARILTPLGAAPVWAWVAAALWFSGPLLVRHSMNGLETGLYTCTVLCALLVFARVLDGRADAPPGAAFALGAMCGLAFLARNDAVFLVLAIFSIWALHGLLALRLPFGIVLRRILPAACLCLLLIAPWLVNNLIGFGSIVPISGTAQSATATFGGNAGLLPAVLLEHALPMVPIPSGLERATPVIAVALAVVAGVVGWFAWRVWRAGRAIRLVVLAYALHGAALVFYYGFNFGAPHFLSRYLVPISPLLVLASVVAVLDLARVVGRAQAPAVAAGAGLVAFAMTGALLAYFATPAQRAQGHFQVVGWVAENVADETWVGAIQTGTLGYWHDRTINLDGKVNPEALAERLRIGTVLDYVVQSEIDVLADWSGIATWVQDTRFGFADAFEVVVDDPAQNLAVLRRRAAE